MVNKHRQNKRKNFKTYKKQQGAKFSNWEEFSKVCKEQEKDEDRKRALELPRNVGFWLQRLN